MEIGLVNEMPTYSGGLGVLAGDTIRSGADLQIPMVAVSLLHRKGYFIQRIDAEGRQHESPAEWRVDAFLQPCQGEASLELAGRHVRLRAWRYDATGEGGFIIPVYFLDADVDGNAPEDRALTHWLYGGDARYRLSQEAVLGIGGVRMLRALGFKHITRFHMNEGHASLLTLELLEEALKGGDGADPIEEVRSRCVFTTHTPVPAGHDQFPMDLVTSVLGANPQLERYRALLCPDNTLNMTSLALNFSRYINGVAKRHGEVSQSMFPQYPIDSITNGIHCVSWASPSFTQLFDAHVPGWREDNFNLRHALKISSREVSRAHREAKRALLDHVKTATGVAMDLNTLTIGFARRAATYKRADLLFQDPPRLAEVTMDFGPIQLIYAGKAHPRDEGGKDLIQRVIRTGRALPGGVRFAYLENYNMALGRLIAAGVDVWLNTPQPPLEASGTSGMKAALNGVPSLSILDGWWVEGHIENVTGWEIEVPPQTRDPRIAEARRLYDKLRKVVMLYYRHPDRFVEIRKHAIALNASFFNTQRMMQQYVVRAYFR